MKRMIMLAVVLSVLIPTLLIGCAVNYYAKNAVREETMDTLTRMAHMMEVHISRVYSSLVSDIEKKTESDMLRSILAADSDGMSADHSMGAECILLDSTVFPVIGGEVINLEGKIILSSQPDEIGLLLNKTELYQEIMSGKDSYTGLVTMEKFTYLVEIAVPIRNKEGKTIGILKQDIDIGILNDYIGSISIGESGYAFLIQNNGFMVFDKAREGSEILYHEYQDKNSLEQLVSDYKAGRLIEDQGIIEYESKGIGYIGAYQKIEAINCIVAVSLDQEKMYGSVMELKGIIAILSLVLLTIITAGGYLIGHYHMAPLIRMNDTLKKIANGDMTARCGYKGIHEFEELSRNINNMADNYQKNEKELRMSSRIDTLTHLPNRNAIYELLDTLLYKHRNQALLLLDLEGFKDVNDNLGYDIGDRILMEVGNILRDLPQHVCYSSRLGGAEFLVFITNWTTPKYPEKIAEKIIKKIEEIRFIDEIHVSISASIGIVYMENDRIDKKKLIKHSNIALHKARSIGRNTYFVHYPYMQKE